MLPPDFVESRNVHILQNTLVPVDERQIWFLFYFVEWVCAFVIDIMG